MARIPNPLEAADKIWKKAAGPTKWPAQPVVKQLPPLVIASDPRRKKKTRVPDNARGY